MQNTKKSQIGETDMIKTSLLLLCFIIFSVQDVNALEKSKSILIKELHNDLIYDHWSGPLKFINNIKLKKLDVCLFLEESEKKYNKVEYVVVRILMILEKSDCYTKKDLALKYLKSNDSQIVEKAIALSRSLSSEERKLIKKEIIKLDTSGVSKSVKKEIEAFLKSLQRKRK